MAIEFRCSGCTTRLKAPDNSSGKRVKCPKCTSLQTIPGAKPAEAELGLKPEVAAQKPTPTPKPTPAAKPKPSPAQAKPQAPQLAPLASSSPFGDLGALANMDLTAGPSVQMAAAALPPSDSVPSVGHRASARTTRKGSTGFTVLKIPAIILVAFGGLGIVIVLYYIVSSLTILTSDNEQANRFFSKSGSLGFMIGYFAWSLFLLFVEIAILRGAICMLSGKNYSAAKTGAILASIPCFNLFGFPFGIWAWVMLASKSVKNNFKS